jgi:hypothetical protein
LPWFLLAWIIKRLGNVCVKYLSNDFCFDGQFGKVIILTCYVSQKFDSRTVQTFVCISNRWPHGESAGRAIAEAKQCSLRPVFVRVTTIYYIEVLRASEGMLSRWSRLHLQPYVPTPVSRRVDVRQAAGRKNNCRIFITT